MLELDRVRSASVLNNGRAAWPWWSGATPPQDELRRARAASRVLIRRGARPMTASRPFGQGDRGHGAPTAEDREARLTPRGRPGARAPNTQGWR